MTFLSVKLICNNFEALANELADYYDLADHAFILETFRIMLIVVFIDNDCLLLEN